ncbi:ArsR/SmtB family transcription factor [Truepera radiovictrix]|uniref:Transcriptional regulator, ArsR family n=1 Tax=Truepera radiovictrix (strain DSM 17093 / CIP 108686 / LMG 22925 / RQ-24) TaxID=649638 RepID=D7CRU2_TRURR|nr:metalloregulator ArsR/SmtB family transcription factor [Truepera radiovictrix]ADI15270.1 transcriptional regulator, ArsR family [Truepera radiovictrix DSM 17093]WMT56179.1 metalloregulator ArsR/SmtB family transcription factor [Truepera radiovictrix]
MEDTNELATTLKALADPVRLAILTFLVDPIQSCCSRDDGVCGCDLEAFLGLSQPTVSHHMKLLTQAGFVRADKRGRWVYYELLPETFEALERALGRFACAARAARTEVTRDA